MCILMNIETQKLTIKNNYYYLFLYLIMNIFSKVTIPHMSYNMHEIQINLLKKTFIYNFDNNNAYTTNWENIESQACELATKIDNNIWVDKFPNANIGFSSQNITDCTRVESYNICNEYIVNLCVGVSTIPNSTNIDVRDQIMFTHEFHSLFEKMNNECFIFDDVMYGKKIKSK